MERPRDFPWDALPLAGILALASLLAWRWPHLPTNIATHFNLGGQADRWTPRTALPVIALGVPTLLWGLIALVGRAQSKERPELAGLLAPFRAFLVLGVAALFGDVLLSSEKGREPLAGLLICLGLVLTGVGWLTQRAWKAQRALPPDPRYRGGVFFYDPADPRLWVPKRLGLGWTLNFARPLSWAVMLALLAIPIVTALLIR
jgi:uncharacterized membrane protein